MNNVVMLQGSGGDSEDLVHYEQVRLMNIYCSVFPPWTALCYEHVFPVFLRGYYAEQFLH